MQKIATKIFIGASVAFGILGIIMIFSSADPDENSSDFNMIIMKLLMTTVFIILPSFASSVAGKYLNSK